MVEAARHGARAERTRAAILEAAEALFAERGFAATRLEDVAERVGIRRASIVYYYRDKRELYDAVLAGVFGGLLERIAEALSGGEPLPRRIERCVSAWVRYVGERPSVARLLLREVADAGPEQQPAVLRHIAPFVELIEEQVMRREPDLGARFERIEPAHLASAIAGATVFFVAAIPALVPELDFDPLDEEHLAAHEQEVLRILRRLLGTRGPRARRAASE